MLLSNLETGNNKRINHRPKHKPENIEKNGTFTTQTMINLFVPRTLSESTLNQNKLNEPGSPSITRFNVDQHQLYIYTYEQISDNK
jgi:hypothetical protein